MKRRLLVLTSCCLGLFPCIWPAIAVEQGSISSARLGTELNAKRELINDVTEIVPDTPKIYCAFKTQGAKSGTPVRGAWIAVDVGDIMPPNYKIAEATLTLTDTIHNGMFNVSEPNTGFPVGKYRVEVYVGDDLAKTIPFTVKAK